MKKKIKYSFYFFTVKLFTYTKSYVYKNQFCMKDIKNVNQVNENLDLINDGNLQVLKVLEDITKFYYHSNGGNLGDVLIAQSEYNFFEKYNLDYEILRRSEENQAENIENLVIGGGGGFVSCWNYQKFFPLLENKKIKKIVIMPSSFYDCDDFVSLIDERFIIFCREKFSFEYLSKKIKNAKIYLATDMALLLNKNNIKQNLLAVSKEKIRSDLAKSIYEECYWVYKYIYQEIKKSLKAIKIDKSGYKVGYFLRKDSENLIDWEKYKIKSTMDFSTVVYENCEDEAMVNILTKLFFASVNMVDIVVTDRLHVGIAGLLLGKKVLWGDNNYGKISGVYEYSLKDNENAEIINPTDINKRLASLKIIKTANDDFFDKMDLTFEEFIIAYSKKYKNAKITNTILGF